MWLVSQLTGWLASLYRKLMAVACLISILQYNNMFCTSG